MADARPPRKPSFVLLVDADAESRDMYAEFLRHASWRVDTAADGASALAKVIGEHPDVIVSELRLPSISGYELIRILQADPATRAIPIVVVTGDAFATDVDRARGCGASLVLTKPCVPETLRESLQAVLDAVRSGAHPGTAHA